MPIVKEKYYKNFQTAKCCVIIPSYNNSQVLEKVIIDVLNFTDQIIIVNDGSTDETLNIIKKYPDINLISYKNNKGKGYALRKAFASAEELGFAYAISIDSDGQHFAKDLPVFLEKLKTNKESVIIGKRIIKKEDRSKGSNFANKFSNFWFFAYTGIKHPDTQSGYRLYPLKRINKRKYFTNKYEFEVEVIVRAAWRGIDVISVPIDVYYPDKNERITHFRPFKDFARITILNTVLLLIALLYGIPARIKHKIKKKSLKTIIKDNILHSKDSNIKLSLSIAFGVFMGIVPLWGWQMVTAVALAFVLKLNKPVVVISSNISIPPMIPIILFASFYTGALISGNDFNLIKYTSDIDFGLIKKDIFQYIIGSLVFATIAGVFSGLLSFLLIIIFRKNKNRV